jgi:hypothetical protein
MLRFVDKVPAGDKMTQCSHPGILDETWLC